MPKSSYSSVVIDVDAEAEPMRIEPASDTPFRILVLGDFSGRAHRGEPPPERLKPYLADRDTLDEVISRMRPELQLGARGPVLRFRELDDFHPDRIHRHEIFAKVEAAKPAAPPAPIPLPPPDVAALTGGSLLDSVLETTEGRPASDVWQEFIERTAAQGAVAREDPRVAQQKAAADAKAGELMRAILHQRDFQALEAAWRGLDWLVRGLETGPLLKVYVLDLAKGDVEVSLHELNRLLMASGEPWSLVVGNYVFSRTAADIELLTRLAGIMHAAGAVFIAETDANDPPSKDAERSWEALSASPEAAAIGLALPRFLLRLPYGAKTSTIDSFQFEEMPGAPAHTDYLWSNPSLACAYLLGQGSSGGQTPTLITGLPVHIYQSEGEPVAKPCAEVLLSEKDAEWVMEQGFMPLVAIKNQDAIRMLRFQSIGRRPLAFRENL